MRVLFRVDSGIGIGMGHVSRCLALAHSLRRRGAECIFVQRPHAGSNAGLIRAAGFAVTALPPPKEAVTDGMDYRAWLGAPVEEDAEHTRALTERVEASWLVVDHYGADAAWETRAKPHAARLLAIDDLADRPHACDMLLDQNFFNAPRKRYVGRIADGTLGLFGPMYALLRPEYASARPAAPPTGRTVTRAFVFYGGGDPGGETERAVRVLTDVDGARIPADVVVSVGNREPERLDRLANDHGAVDLHGPRTHLADLLAHAQLGLGAGGVTALERCTLGVPAVVTTIATNQIAVTQALAEAGACLFAGRREDMTDKRLSKQVASLLFDRESRDRIVRNAWLMTDGRGAERTAEVLKPTPITALRLRPAHQGDKYLYYVWANDPVVRSNAFNPEPITWSDHDSWFDAKLAADETILLVLETPQDLPLGQFRVDVDAGVGVIGYSISQSFRGRGLGVRILHLAVDYLRRHTSMAELVGYVLPDNAASQLAFARAGFRDEGASSDGTRKFAVTLQS